MVGIPQYDGLNQPRVKAMSALHLIHINWHIEYGALYWSWGYCNACQDYGAVRLQDFTKRLYLNGLIPMGRGEKGKVAHCDFCRRGIEQVWNWEGIPWTDWSPPQGVATLARKCDVPDNYLSTDLSSEARLHSLLSSAKQSAALTRMALGPRGILLGVAIGLVVTLPLAMFLYETKLVRPQMTELGFTLLFCLLGVLPGALIGAVVECLRKREQSALKRLAEAYSNYPFDLQRLEELSRDYNKGVQKAVQALCEYVQPGR